MNNPPRVHHFIAQFWIRRFASRDGKIWAYGRNESSVRVRSAKALMQIVNLYTVQPSGADDTTLETVDLNEVDRKGSIAFDRVLNGDRSETAKEELATFISAQIMRDPETIVSYNPKAQELTLSLLEAFDAPDYPTCTRIWAENFPGAEMKEEEYDHIRSLGLKGAENALEQIISALESTGGLPELPFTDLIRNPDGRSVLRDHLLRFSWSLKTDTDGGFVLGDTGVLYQREALTDGLKLPLSSSAALYLAPVANPLSSDAKCNTPRRFDIGKVDQDLKECCHAILFASLGRGKRPNRHFAGRGAVDGGHCPGARSGENHHLQGAAAERTLLGRVFPASRRRSLSIAQAA